mmetsp:Transcript_36075/g.74166  ORF Transcript_36075/g.74166 Transcript_36075/m.74166 type:complete len:83 (-) Transcript_36075:594-842(-)
MAVNNPTNLLEPAEEDPGAQARGRQRVPSLLLLIHCNNQSRTQWSVSQLLLYKILQEGQCQQLLTLDVHQLPNQHVHAAGAH